MAKPAARLRMIGSIGRRLATLGDRQLLIFTAARVGGLALKPLIIFAAASAGRDVFAERYALLISALASLFVLTGGQTHIDYYKQRFGAGGTAVRHSFDRYFGDSIIQFLFVLPLVAMLAWAWSDDPLLIAIIVLLVGIEKFFDEDQRHFLYTRQYGRWSLNFGARVILPSLIILPLIWLLPEPLIVAYALACVFSFLLYLLHRRRHSKLYGAMFRRKVSDALLNARSVFGAFWTRWRTDYAFNQLWSFTSINIYLVDRFWVAQQSELPLDAYVFFDSILKAAVIAHSLFYYIPRRPELIKAEARPVAELLRLPNVVLGVAFCAGALAVGFAVKMMAPTYGWVAPWMLVGMAVFYFLQATAAVVVDVAFWHTSRRRLILVDLAAIGWIFLLYLLIEPELWAVPWLAASGVAARMLLYVLLSGSGRSGDRTKAEAAA